MLEKRVVEGGVVGRGVVEGSVGEESFREVL